MTPLVRRYIKTSFVFLVVGLTLGAYSTVRVNLLGQAVAWPVIVAHSHLVLVGFVLMLIFGVATWMFPRPGREGTRYRPGLGEVVYWLLTASTAARTIGELGLAAAGMRGGSVLAAAGGLGQLLGALLFVLNMWTRVRTPGSSRTDVA